MYYWHHERFFDPASNQWTVGCNASEVGASSDSDSNTSQKKLIPMKSSLIFKDLMAGMKVAT